MRLGLRGAGSIGLLRPAIVIHFEADPALRSTR